MELLSQKIRPRGTFYSELSKGGTLVPSKLILAPNNKFREGKKSFINVATGEGGSTFSIYSRMVTVTCFSGWKMRILHIFSERVMTAAPLMDDRELKQATFLNHGRKPEINISHVRTVVSLRFSKKSSPLVKRYLAIKMW